MRRINYFIICMALAVFTVHGANAQNTIKIDLEQAIEIALNENPTIMIADMEIERQEYVIKEGKGNLLPTLSGSGLYNYNILNQVMFMPEGLFGPGSGGPVRMGFDNSYTGSLSLSLPLYMPTVYKLLQMNEQQMKLTVEAARASKITLVNQVKKTYYSILLAESSLDVIKKNIEYAEVIVNDTRNSFNQELSSEYDLITAEVQLSNLKPTLIQTENSIRISRFMLNMLLSLPLDTKLELDDTLYDYRDKRDPAGLMGADLSDNTDIRQLEIQKNLLHAQLKMQRAQKQPNLNAIAQYSVLSQSNDFRVGHYQWKSTALAGLQLNVPIFAGLTRTNKERQIKKSISQVELQQKYLNENIDVQAQTAMSNITQAQEQMTANDATKTQAQKGYRIAKTRYDVGAGTIVELNSAQMALLQADMNYSQSIYDYLSALADYEQILGIIQ